MVAAVGYEPTSLFGETRLCYKGPVYTLRGLRICKTRKPYGSHNTVYCTAQTVQYTVLCVLTSRRSYYMILARIIFIDYSGMR